MRDVSSDGAMAALATEEQSSPSSAYFGPIPSSPSQPSGPAASTTRPPGRTSSMSASPGPLNGNGTPPLPYRARTNSRRSNTVSGLEISPRTSPPQSRDLRMLPGAISAEPELLESTQTSPSAQLDDPSLPYRARMMSGDRRSTTGPRPPGSYIPDGRPEMVHRPSTSLSSSSYSQSRPTGVDGPYDPEREARERRLALLRTRLFNARQAIPEHVLLKIFRYPEECSEALEILDAVQNAEK